MKLLEFWEEISLMPDAVRQLEKLEILVDFSMIMCKMLCRYLIEKGKT